MNYYNDAELDTAWRTAVLPTQSFDYLDAVTTLARRRHELDAPVFVHISGQLVNADWHEVAAGSKPLCRCGQRRMIIPATGRTLLQPQSPSVVLDVRNPLAILPWGGDCQSAYVQFRCDPVYGLVSRSLPYGHDTYEVPGVLVHKGLHSNESAFSLEELADIVRIHGGNVCMQPVGDFNFSIVMIQHVDVVQCNVTCVLDRKVQRLEPILARQHHSCAV